ncbi:MAG TPA: hypothetical protein VLF67_02680 [Candidatus Saccharimonas sp.]|nr:hypothetical protein [Candidatus Saccharimonas sp.]
MVESDDARSQAAPESHSGRNVMADLYRQAQEEHGAEQRAATLPELIQQGEDTIRRAAEGEDVPVYVMTRSGRVRAEVMSVGEELDAHDRPQTYVHIRYGADDRESEGLNWQEQKERLLLKDLARMQLTDEQVAEVTSQPSGLGALDGLTRRAEAPAERRAAPVIPRVERPTAPVATERRERAAITTARQLFEQCMEASQRAGTETREQGVGHYTEVHVVQGRVLVAPNPVDTSRHWARALGGSHSMFEVMQDHPDRFRDVAPIVQFAAHNHLGYSTYAARAGLVERGGERVLQLHHFNGGSYESAHGRVRGNGWIDDLMTLAPALGIDRVEQVTGTGADAKVFELRDDTTISAQLTYQHFKTPEYQGPYVPPGTASGEITGATLDVRWIRGQTAAADQPLQRRLDTLLTVADMAAPRHEQLREALEEQGIKQPNASAQVEWQGRPLGVNGNYSTDTRSERNMASVSLALISDAQMSELQPVIEAFGRSLTEAAIHSLSSQREIRYENGAMHDRPMDLRQHHFNFFVHVTNSRGQSTGTFRWEGPLGEIMQHASSYYQTVSPQRFRRIFEPQEGEAGQA